MQTMETTLDLSAIFELETFDAESYQALKELAFAGTQSINRFRELLADYVISPGTPQMIDHLVDDRRLPNVRRISIPDQFVGGRSSGARI